MPPILGLAATLSAFWLLLSGHYTPLLLGFGAASVGLVLWLSRRMALVDHEAHHLKFGRRVPAYWGWLAREILISSWDITRRVIRGGSQLDPVLYRLETPGLSDVALVTYANSLTLTPGTLAVDVEHDHMNVHALHPELMAGVATDTMGARVRVLELD